jgi:hypothetical protein
MLATTKQVRNIVHTLCNVSRQSYTDKSTRGENVRNVSFILYEANEAAALALVQLAMFTRGYTNNVKLTHSKYDSIARQGGSTYLRINNCVLEK